MPTPQLPRIEELEYWSTGEKARLAKAGTLSGSDTVTIPIELYEKVFPLSHLRMLMIDGCTEQTDSPASGRRS